MSTWKRKIWLGTFLAASLAVSAACTAVPAAPAADTGAADAAATEAPAAEAAGEAAGGEKTRLVIAQSVDVQGLEPSNVNSRAESNIFGHVFAQLYDITETGEIKPYLAESYTATEDGLEMTFTLNEGLVCHDGEPLTAEDVAYTFSRAADPANAFTGNTAGFVLDGIGFVEARADSDLEVTIVMDKYTPVALGLIAEVYIHCKDAYEAMSLEDAAANPIGSGPYRFVEWVKDDYVLLEKAPEFTLKTPAYDELEWKVIPEASTRSAELIAGNVDIITNVPPDQHAAIDASGSAAVAGVSGTRRMYIGYNLGDEFSSTPDGQIIQDPKVRIALQYAVDVPTICQTLLAFDCARASSMVNPPNDNPNLEAYPFDPAMAEQLLDEAGYPRGEDGVRFEIGMMAGKGRYLNDVNVVLALAQYLTDVGVKVNLQQMEWGSEFVPLLREHKVGPLFFVGTGGSTWSAVYDMSDISTPDAATNYTEWNNADWFAGWEQIALTRDPAELRTITDGMLEVMFNDPPWLFLYFQPDFYGIAGDVNWEPRRDEIIDATTAAPQ
jgi:peptide/nickel transport system substrate-binding protein